MISDIIIFLYWSFMLYWIHRAAHVVPWMHKIHMDHHNYILYNTTHWHYSNLLLFNDTWCSTLDLWITEVIPTIIFAFLFDASWIFVIYYVWTAFLQESLEHSKLDWYPFTAGRWHMIHHVKPNRNFSLFLPIWDKLFNTEQKI